MNDVIVETINERNRPCDSYFYCGAPSYYKLKYQVYNFLSATDERKPDVSGSSFVLKDKFALERILDESMGRKKVWHKRIHDNFAFIVLC